MREKFIQPKLKTEVQKRDLFYTPKYAIDLLIPFIPKNITKIWECASGAGHIARVLESSGYTVFETDLQQGLIFYLINQILLLIRIQPLLQILLSL